jgi:hypothetical protein
MIQRNAQTAQATMWRELLRNVRRGEGRRGEGRERCNRNVEMVMTMMEAGRGRVAGYDCYGLFGGSSSSKQRELNRGSSARKAPSGDWAD